MDTADGLTDSGIVNRYPIHPAWRQRYAPDVRENTEYVFSLLLAMTVDIQLSLGEHLECRWLPREAAAGLATSVTDRAAILALVPAVSP